MKLVLVTFTNHSVTDLQLHSVTDLQFCSSKNWMKSETLPGVYKKLKITYNNLVKK